MSENNIPTQIKASLVRLVAPYNGVVDAQELFEACQYVCAVGHRGRVQNKGKDAVVNLVRLGGVGALRQLMSSVDRLAQFSLTEEGTPVADHRSWPKRRGFFADWVQNGLAPKEEKQGTKPVVNVVEMREPTPKECAYRLRKYFQDNNNTASVAMVESLISQIF